METDGDTTTDTRGRRVDPMGQVDGATPIARQRHIATRVLAAMGLVAFALSVVIVVSDILNPMANEAALVPAGSPEAQIGADRPAETVHLVGAMATLLVGGSGLAALAMHPQRLGSANHTIAAMLASVIAMGVMGDPDNHGGQAGPFDPAFLIFAVPGMAAALAARPWMTWRRRHLARPRFVALAAAGVPFLWYGTHQALLQRNTWPPLADPHHQAHWYLMAVLAFMIVTVTASAAVTVRGWRLAAVTAALSAIALGATGLVAPTAASSLPPLWAALAIAWGGGGLALAGPTRDPTAHIRYEHPLADHVSSASCGGGDRTRADARLTAGCGHVTALERPDGFHTARDVFTAPSVISRDRYANPTIVVPAGSIVIHASSPSPEVNHSDARSPSIALAAASASENTELTSDTAAGARRPPPDAGAPGGARTS